MLGGQNGGCTLEFFLLEDVEKILYPSCRKFTKQSAFVKLYNLKA